jgi:hypothetical protein
MLMAGCTLHQLNKKSAPIWLHAGPPELMLAAAGHVVAASILLNALVALWASLDFHAHEL